MIVLRPVTNPFPIRRSGPPAAATVLGPLRALIAPRPGERILEVGAGTGCYALEVAAEVGPSGTVDILDAHPEMLAEAMRRAGARGLSNISPTLGDARFLPFDDATFDAAYLVAALGDIADAAAALRELRRVRRANGRLAVGELHGDPHRVARAKLDECAGAAGMHVAQQVDGLLGYVAQLTPRGG
jgi:ubiquinone/menaquinone biosynthesis C-methylase UbiE